MPTLYMIDAHDSALGSSKINDTVNVPAGFTETRSLRGSFPVTVGFDTPLDGLPTDLNDLITRKYAGMLSLYPGYQNILFDEQIDAASWATLTTAGITVGERQTTTMYADSTTLQSSLTSLASTPTMACFRWEAFESAYNDATGVTGTRTYRELDTTSWAAEVTFNGGTTYQTVTSGLLFPIALADQGSSFRVRFNRTGLTPDRANLGGWALIY